MRWLERLASRHPMVFIVLGGVVGAVLGVIFANWLAPA